MISIAHFRSKPQRWIVEVEQSTKPGLINIPPKRWKHQKEFRYSMRENVDHQK
jgi:hypothetical protein